MMLKSLLKTVLEMRGDGARVHIKWAAVLFLLSAAFWHKIVFTGQVLFFDLTEKLFFPSFALYKSALAAKTIPLWNPFVLCGMPFLANPQAGCYYPFNIVYALTGFAAAIKISIVLHAFMAGLFMYFLSRSMKFGTAAAVLSAAVYMFNGFFVLHAGILSNASSYAWTPLVFLFFRKALADQKVFYALLAALFAAVQVFAGFPQFTYYCAVVMFFYAVFARTGPGIVKKAGYLALFAASTAVFSMAQVLPALEVVKNSVRGGGMGFEHAAVYSISPEIFAKFIFLPLWDWFKPFWPDDPHITGFYFSVVALVLVFVSVKKLMKGEISFFLWVFIVSLALSLGSYLPVYKLFYHAVPGWKYFRFPAQVNSMSAFAFALLAGYSVGNMRSTRLKTVVVALIVAELFLFGAKAHQLIDDSYYETKTGNIELLAGDGDLFRYVVTPEAASGRPEFDEDYLKRWLNHKDMLHRNTGGAYMLFDIDGRESFTPARYDSLLRTIDTPYTPVLDLLNVKYLLTMREISDPSYRLIKKGHVNVYKNNRHLPRVFFAPKALYLPESGILDYMSSNRFDPWNEVIFSAERKPGDFKPDASSVKKDNRWIVSIGNYSFNEIRVSVDSQDAGWLVFSENYYPGWKAEIDGKNSEILLADYALRALAVKPGRHKIRMYYDPWPVKAGLAVSGAAFAGFLVYAFVYFRRNGNGSRNSG
ncbi:MAG: YfhO family protein [Endomicrobiales bacterium]|nr:YfhO family protein [Endomicrobiales bacterium]